VPQSRDYADRNIFWKHNLALSAILWFKSQNSIPGGEVKP